MKNFCIGTVSCLVALLAGVPGALVADTFSYGRSGIASVRVGTDCLKVPSSCPGLYSRAEYIAHCGGEDGEGVEVLYYDADSPDFIISAVLDLDQEALDRLYDEGLDCRSYPISDPWMENFLDNTGSTRIAAVTVAPSPHITVNIGGRETATTEPARKFMEMPGAVTTASLGEGILLTCTLGDLTMTVLNAYGALSPDVEGEIYRKMAAALETGVFEPVEISPSDVNPETRFDYFFFNPESEPAPDGATRI